jgi:hypothetical protein
MVDRFIELDDLPDGSMPVASLAILWYVEPSGQQFYVAKIDGDIDKTTAIGALMRLSHEYMHDDE